MPAGNSSKLDMGAAPGGAHPSWGQRSLSRPSSRAPGTEQGPNFCSSCCASSRKLSLGYGTQLGYPSRIPGWKLPSCYPWDMGCSVETPPGFLGGSRHPVIPGIWDAAWKPLWDSWVEAAILLSLGYGMQRGNLSGIPGWKPPSCYPWDMGRSVETSLGFLGGSHHPVIPGIWDTAWKPLWDSWVEAAILLSLGYGMQLGNPSGIPGWKPPSEGNAWPRRCESGQHPPVGECRWGTRLGADERGRPLWGSAQPFPACRTRAARLGSTWGSSTALHPGQSPGEAREESGLSCGAVPPERAGSSRCSRPAREGGKSSTDFSGCDDKDGGASKRISMQEFCITCLCIWYSGPEAAKIKLKLIFFFFHSCFKLICMFSLQLGLGILSPLPPALKTFRACNWPDIHYVLPVYGNMGNLNHAFWCLFGCWERAR